MVAATDLQLRTAATHRYGRDRFESLPKSDCPSKRPRTPGLRFPPLKIASPDRANSTPGKPVPQTHHEDPQQLIDCVEAVELGKFSTPQSGLLGKPRLLRSSGLWIPRLHRTARLPLRGLRIAKQFGIPRLFRTPGLRIPEPTAISSLFRLRVWIARGRLFRRAPFGGLVAWGRVRDRAC
jgi:hypothetical protein